MAAPPPTPARPTTSPWLGRQVFLALANANHAREHVADENEGLLTAEEVTTLDLSGVDWVVLSACQTAAGRPGRGKVYWACSERFTWRGRAR